MGILGVQVPGELYDQEEDRAWDELLDKTEKLETCLRSIYPTDPYDEMDRIEKMKGVLLPGSYNWIFSNSDFQLWCDYPNGQLLWISGDTGKGKTMLLCGIIKELDMPALVTYRLAYFFFQATDSRMNTATAVLRGLLYMVVQQQPRLRVHVTERYFDVRSSLVGDTYSFKSIKEAFTDVIQDPEFQTTYFIIDGLDQCMVDQQNLLDFVIHSTKSFRVSWIVSSCESPQIQEQWEPWSHQVRFDVESNANFITASLQSFIAHKVSMLAHQNTYTEQTRDAVILHLAANAENSFLWVATACKHLETVTERNIPDVLATLLPGLDTLYQQALQSMHQVPNFEVLYKPLLAMVTVLYRPIHLDELLALMDLRDQDGNPVLTENIMDACEIFLVLQGDVVHFSHHSARDFLARSTRILPSGPKDGHRLIYERSLRAMSRILRQSIYELQDWGTFVEDAEPSHDSSLSASRYSCIYWIEHLCESIMVDSSELPAQDILEGFLSTKFSLYFEALSFCKGISSAISSMDKLRSLSKV
jgi:hypothetical protein